MPVVNASGIQPGMAAKLWYWQGILHCKLKSHLLCFFFFLQWLQVSPLLNLSTEMYLFREYTFAFPEKFSLTHSLKPQVHATPENWSIFFLVYLPIYFDEQYLTANFRSCFFSLGTKAQKIFTLSEFWWHLMLRRWCFCSVHSASDKLVINVVIWCLVQRGNK